MKCKKIAIVIGSVLALYVTGYFLLMRTSAPAIGDDGHPVFSSGFVFAKLQRIEGDLSIYGPSVTWANYFFLPIDQLWRNVNGFTPSRWDHEQEMKRWSANKQIQNIATNAATSDL